MAKYCGICGEKCEDHTMYCSRCGERFPGEPSPAGGIKGFLTKKLICAAAAAFGVVLALVLIFSGRLKTIHLEDFVTITSFDNASGSGTVTCRFDRDALETRLYENAKVSDRDLSFSNLAVYGSESYDIISRVELEVENNGKLRNGDDVVVNVTYNGENKSKIFKSKIEGGKFILRHCKKFLEPVFIDLLSDEYLQVTFSGADGFGTCSVKGINGDTLDADLGDYFLEFEADVTQGLSNGDTVTVRPVFFKTGFPYQTMVKKGYVFDEDAEREFTVSGLTRYASAEDLSEVVLRKGRDVVLNSIDGAENHVEGCRYKIVETVFKKARVINSEEGYSAFMSQEPACFNRLFFVVKELNATDSLPENDPEEKLDDEDVEGTVFLFAFSNLQFAEDGSVVPEGGWNMNPGKLNFYCYSFHPTAADPFLRSMIHLAPEIWDVSYLE